MFSLLPFLLPRKSGLVWRSTVALAAATLSVPAHAQARAGADIANTAAVRFSIDGVTGEVASNTVQTKVAELIDVSVVPAPACATARSDGLVALGFLITNKGNGFEAFIPGVPVVVDGTFSPTLIAIDSNGDGCYEAGTDEPIPPGGATPELPPGGSVIVFVVGPDTGFVGTVSLPVWSKTGSGASGTILAGQGDGGSDAVIGRGGGRVSGETRGKLSPLQASLIKSQSVRDKDGSDTPALGATITYTIEARFTGNGTANDVVIRDPVPAYTRYISGSLTLDGQRLTDADDGDAGSETARDIAVNLGNVSAPATRTVTFKVLIISRPIPKSM